MKKITLALLLAIFCTTLSIHAQGDSKSFTPEQKFLRTMQLLRTSYVDSVDMERLVEHGIKMMLEHLDPHSVYMTADEVKRANEPLQGNFEGVGIQFQIIRDTVHVISTISGGPSEEVGIIAGDRIVEIDGEAFVGSIVTNTSVADKLRGTKGTKVIIGILRGSAEEILQFEVIRDKIPIYSVDAAFMLDDKTGFIKINRFSGTTMDEFNEAMNKLKSQNMQNLVLDLRNNSGGFLKTSIDLADQFLDRNLMIVYTEGVNMRGDKYYSTSKGAFKEGKLVVLIDHGSASASEIVSGAVQDWDRGVLIGRRSYGKGLVQKPFNYPDGSAVRLTTARYYTPTGRCIQKPYDDDKKKYLLELNERLESGELVSMDSLSFPDSLMFTTPNGRKVYGGGGVLPDVFVPIDTNKVSQYYIDISRKNIFNQFVADYLQKNRKSLKKQFETVDAFKTAYLPKADELIEELMLYADKLEVERTELSDDTRKFMGYVLVGLLARNLYDQQAYFIILLDLDVEIAKALEILYSDQYEKILGKKE
jgi:carboxyl-terminal processing protease